MQSDENKGVNYDQASDNYEKLAGTKLVIEQDVTFRLVKFHARTSSTFNYLTVKKPNDVRLLSAKINGVTLQANLYKPGNYNHDNSTLAYALRDLADLIENLSIRLADQDNYQHLPQPNTPQLSPV